MADEQTEAEWKKSKQIEAERMKAARAIAEEKPDRVSAAFLDPKSTKVKGWSNDPDVILADGEKMGNRALVFAFAGVVLSFIGTMGSIVSETFNLGLAGVILDIPHWVGLACIALAVLMAMAGVSCEVYFKFKKKRKFSVGFWSSLLAIGFIVIYYVLTLIIRFS